MPFKHFMLNNLQGALSRAYGNKNPVKNIDNK